MTFLSFRRLLALVLPLFFAVATAHAQDVHTPPAGSKERKAIMDALRPAFERAIGQEVVFKVEMLRVSEDWAAVRVTPQTPDGDDIDYSRTKYREQVKTGAFDPTGEALLQMKDGSGSWKVVKWQFGGTDSNLSYWIKENDAPASLDR